MGLAHHSDAQAYAMLQVERPGSRRQVIQANQNAHRLFKTEKTTPPDAWLCKRGLGEPRPIE